MIGDRYQKAFIYLLFFLSGSSGLIYEIIWNRKLTLIFGATGLPQWRRKGRDDIDTRV